MNAVNIPLIVVWSLAAAVILTCAFSWLHPDVPGGDAPADPVDPHQAPATPPSVAQAQRDMQIHLECRRGTCGAKQSAFEVLVAARRIRPATLHREA